MPQEKFQEMPLLKAKISRNVTIENFSYKKFLGKNFKRNATS